MSESSRRGALHGNRLVLTCEHGGNRIPREYAYLFKSAARAVNSHRGWDPGALELARYLGRFFHLPVHYVTWCRLLVESNRAPTNPRIWSQYTAGLPAVDKKEILARYWWPHRREVEAHIQNELAEGSSVVHVAVHSFVPVLGGTRKNADIGLLYDSRCPREKALCRRWQTVLKSMDPALRVRRNYPYPGLTDGLCTWLRRRHPTDRYVGVELEVNQAQFAGKSRVTVQRLIARSLEELLR
ncbi:MAG: N-formylglutamate amidohydrolase [Gammaproteobacteria bacterium]